MTAREQRAQLRAMGRALQALYPQLVTALPGAPDFVVIVRPAASRCGTAHLVVGNVTLAERFAMMRIALACAEGRAHAPPGRLQ